MGGLAMMMTTMMMAMMMTTMMMAMMMTTTTTPEGKGRGELGQ